MTEAAGVAVFPVRTCFPANDIWGLITVLVGKETRRSGENGFNDHMNAGVFSQDHGEAHLGSQTGSVCLPGSGSFQC